MSDGPQTTAYYPHELPEHLKQAIRDARMDPRHDHLNALMEEPVAEQPQSTHGIRKSDYYARLFDPPGPVSAEWLRKLAANLDGKAEALMRGETPHPCDFYRASACLRAAADELDRLRGASEHGEADACRACLGRGYLGEPRRILPYQRIGCDRVDPEIRYAVETCPVCRGSGRQ